MITYPYIEVNKQFVTKLQDRRNYLKLISLLRHNKILDISIKLQERQVKQAENKITVEVTLMFDEYITAVGNNITFAKYESELNDEEQSIIDIISKTTFPFDIKLNEIKTNESITEIANGTQTLIEKEFIYRILTKKSASL